MSSIGAVGPCHFRLRNTYSFGGVNLRWARRKKTRAKMTLYHVLNPKSWVEQWVCSTIFGIQIDQTSQNASAFPQWGKHCCLFGQSNPTPWPFGEFSLKLWVGTLTPSAGKLYPLKLACEETSGAKNGLCNDIYTLHSEFSRWLPSSRNPFRFK